MLAGIQLCGSSSVTSLAFCVGSRVSTSVLGWIYLGRYAVMTSQSTSIQYAYALDSQGALTHISDALRSHTYTCPGCKSPIIPVLGEINAKHFRHSEGCCALETYLHKCAKEAFFYR
ncbi:hypothetical protein V2S84_24305, partial [Azotobacter chroococcum]|nr:hypothetical protein [Azotobacter chroococcum]